MVIDTHAHLCGYSLNCECEYPIVNVSVDLKSSISNSTHQLSSSFVIPALGIHPWYVSELSFFDLPIVFKLARYNNIHILGEIGLDFSKKFKSTAELQLSVFRMQLEFAYNHQMAVSIHMVKSFEAIYSLLKLFPVRGVVHGFSGSVEQAQLLINLGLYIGINGVCLRRNTPKYDRLISEIPLSAIVVETDFPNVPISSGHPAKLSIIFSVIKYIADIKQCSVEMVSDVTTQNAIKGLQLYEFR
jgi:TatD DNase family protein